MVGRRGRGGALVGEIPPRSVSSGESGRCPEAGQHPSGHTDRRSCRQECQRAAFGSATTAISDVWSAPHNAGLNRHGVSRTEQMEAAAGPPSPDGAAPPRVPGERNIAGATTHGDVARLEACPRCERHEEVTTRYRCPCHKAKWRRALQAVSPPWGLHAGTTLHIISGVPRSHTCIAEEGEGTHDWAAVPADHVHVLAALQASEFRQWAAIVQFFATDM